MTAPWLETVATLISLSLLLTAIGLLKSYHDGHLRDWIEKRREEREVRGDGSGLERHERIVQDLEEIKTDVKQTKGTVETLCDQQEQVCEAIVVLHREDRGVDEEQLREKMGVETLPGDLVKGDD